MSKRLFLIVLLTAVLGISTACNDNRADTATQYMEALNTGNLEEAQELACPERADDIVAALMGVTSEERARFSFINLSCSPRGDEVSCRYTITQQTEDGTPVQSDRNVVFQFEDGQICDFEQEVAE